MRHNLTLLGLVTAGLLASTAAYAVPINNAAGIGIPLGPDYITQTDFETRITPTSPNFMGVGQVTSISSDGINNATYGLGSTPYLYDEFSGFTLRTITNVNMTTGAVIDPTQQIQIFLTGGELNYYSFSSPLTNLTSAGSAAQDVANVKAGNLWLSLTPVAEDSEQDTVIITINAGFDLQTVGLSQAEAFLDVNTALNGAANGFFDTCDVVDSSAPGPSSSPTVAHDCLAGAASISFVGGGQNILSPNDTDFQIHGTDNDQATSVPEPLTISLFGGGLIGMAALRRRKASKA